MVLYDEFNYCCTKQLLIIGLSRILTLFLYLFTPLYPIPNALMQKITNCSINIADDHKPKRHFNLACK